jgi:hypothetical protein
MPHLKAFPAVGRGATVVFAISMSVLAGAMFLVTPGAAFLGTCAASALGGLRKALGAASPSIAVVSDSQAVIMTGAGARTVVAGRILDAEGNPVAGSAVRVRSEARPSWDWVTSSASDGSFRVEGVAAGKVQVAAHDIAAGSVESALLDVDEARHVVLVFDRTVEVSGVVLDERGAPVARAAVRCAPKSEAPARVVITDEDGRFALRGAAGSIDRLTVWARGFEATTISVGAVASDVIRRDVRLSAARPLRGFILDASGAAVAGARVCACPGKEAEVAASDAAGAFELPATVIGCWIAAYHPRYAGARPLHIADRRALVLRLGAGGVIEGTAADEHGKPIGLFSVSIASFEAEEGPPGVPTRMGETSEHWRGSFRLDDLAPGSYVLHFSAEGRVDADSKPIEVGRGRVIRGEQIVLTAADVEDGAGAGEEPSLGASAESGETTEAGSDETTKGEEAAAPSEAEPVERSE